MVQPKPFIVNIPDEVLDDLRGRLVRTRLPEPLPQPGWIAGVDLGYLRALLDHWSGSFDWRVQERRLNSFPPVHR